MDRISRRSAGHISRSWWDMQQSWWLWSTSGADEVDKRFFRQGASKRAHGEFFLFNKIFLLPSIQSNSIQFNSPFCWKWESGFFFVLFLLFSFGDTWWAGECCERIEVLWRHFHRIWIGQVEWFCGGPSLCCKEWGALWFVSPSASVIIISAFWMILFIFSIFVSYPACFHLILYYWFWLNFNLSFHFGFFIVLCALFFKTQIRWKICLVDCHLKLTSLQLKLCNNSLTFTISLYFLKTVFDWDRTPSAKNW